MHPQALARSLLILVAAIWSPMAEAAVPAPAPVVHDVTVKDWTLATPWGPVGLFSVTSTDKNLTANSGRDGYLYICAGPLGKATVSISHARAVAQWRTIVPVLIATGLVLYVVWTRPRHRTQQEGDAAPPNPAPDSESGELSG